MFPVPLCEPVAVSGCVCVDLLVQVGTAEKSHWNWAGQIGCVLYISHSLNKFNCNWEAVTSVRTKYENTIGFRTLRKMKATDSDYGNGDVGMRTMYILCANRPNSMQTMLINGCTISVVLKLHTIAYIASWLRSRHRHTVYRVSLRHPLPPVLSASRCAMRNPHSIVVAIYCRRFHRYTLCIVRE